MDWRIQVVDPTAAADVKAILEAERDTWIKTTPQESHDLSDINDLIQTSKGQDGSRAKATKMKRDAIAAKSVSLDATHTGIVAQMNAGIAAAVVLASASSHPVRVSVFGHFKTLARDGIYKRLSVSVDDAAHG